MTTISNRQKGSDACAGAGSALEMRAEQENGASAGGDLRDMALFVNGGLFRSLTNNPVKEIGVRMKQELIRFIADNRHSSCEMGFLGHGDAVDIRPLQQTLERSAERLENYIAGKGLPLQHVEIRLVAVPLQRSLELFALSLQSTAEQGDISAREVLNVVRGAIELKAEISELLLQLEAAQLRLAEACENSTS